MFINQYNNISISLSSCSSKHTSPSLQLAFKFSKHANFLRLCSTSVFTVFYHVFDFFSPKNLQTEPYVSQPCSYVSNLCFIQLNHRQCNKHFRNSCCFRFHSAPQCLHCKRCTSYSNAVRLSVCLSVTRRYCFKTTTRSTVHFALSNRKMCLVL